MNIIICEDNKHTGFILKKIVETWVYQNNIKAKTYLVVKNFEQVVEYAQNNNDSLNVYILDIALNENINGLVLAKNIRNFDLFGYVIFITGYSEFLTKSFQYKLRALDYICKSHKKLSNRLIDCLNTIKKETTMKEKKRFHNNMLVVKSGNEYYNVAFSDIIYFETVTVQRKILLHTKKEQIQFYDTLKNLQKELNDNFYRCHRAYLINTNHVKKINIDRQDLHAIMSNGDKCFISKNKLKGLIDIVN